ncbi:hypothetical protein Tco_0099638 [Tanacetum coccineum]
MLVLQPMNKRCSKTVIEEVAQSEEGAYVVDSKETKEYEEEPLVRTRSSGVVIGGEVHRESDEERIDHSKKLKGLETLKGSGEGSGVTLEVPDELTCKSSNKGASVIPEKDTEEHVTEEHVVEKQDGEEEHGDEQVDRPPLVDITVTLILDTTTITPTQPPPTQPKRNKPKRILKKSKKPDTQVDSGELECIVTKLEKKVHAMSSFSLPDAIDKLVKSHLKKVLPADVPEFGKIKMEKAAKQSMPKYSSIPFDQAALDEFEEKDKLFQMMSKSRSYNRLPAYKALYDTLALSLNVDEHDMENDLKQQPSQKNRHKGEPSKGTTAPSGPPPSKKAVDYGDATPSQDRSKWFKQSPRHETPDLEWSKDPNADVGPKQNWLHKLEKTAKDPSKFDDRRGSTIDFSNFIKHRIKKDKITKADLEGLVFKLLKGTWERCPHDLSKPLPLQGPPGHLTILVEFFFTNDPEYMKNGNKERKYATSVTKTKDVRNLSLGSQVLVIHRSRNVTKSRHDVFSHLHILGVVRLTIDNQFGYGYMKEIVLGYNDAMLKRKWSEKDQERIVEMLKLIDDLLLERRIMRSLECYVGGRLNETGY